MYGTVNRCPVRKRTDRQKTKESQTHQNHTNNIVPQNGRIIKKICSGKSEVSFEDEKQTNVRMHGQRALLTPARNGTRNIQDGRTGDERSPEFVLHAELTGKTII